MIIMAMALFKWIIYGKFYKGCHVCVSLKIRECGLWVAIYLKIFIIFGLNFLKRRGGGMHIAYTRLGKLQ